MTDDQVTTVLNSIDGTPDGESPNIDSRALLISVSNSIRSGILHAVRHPVGFTLVDLSAEAEAEPGIQFRLHIWSQISERRDGLGSIHDHSWSLTSAVIVGELVDTNLTATEDPSGDHGFVRVKYTDEGNQFRWIGRHRLSTARQRRICAPCVYRLPPGVLHSTDVKVTPTATLVIADRRPTGNDEPLVVTKGDNPPKSTGNRVFVPVLEAIDAIDDLVDHIPATGTSTDNS